MYLTIWNYSVVSYYVNAVVLAGCIFLKFRLQEVSKDESAYIHIMILLFYVIYDALHVLIASAPNYGLHPYLVMSGINV